MSDIDQDPTRRLLAAADILDQLDRVVPAGPWEWSIRGTRLFGPSGSVLRLFDRRDITPESANALPVFRSLAGPAAALLRGEAAAVQAEVLALQLNDPDRQAEARLMAMQAVVSPHAIALADAVLAHVVQKEAE